MRGPVSFACSAALVAFALAACGVKIQGAQPVSAEGDFPCNDSVDCPAANNPCLLSQCYDGQCVFVPSPAGQLPEDDQVAGDCKMLQCDGDGGTTTIPARYDVPADDGNRCTEAVCDMELAKQSPRIAGALCPGEGEEGGLCNGAGKCGVCLPGKERCEGHATTSCNPDGQWSEPKACGAAKPVCVGSKCLGVVELASGNRHACVRLDHGQVRCWGAVPNSVIQPPKVSASDQLAFGLRHACRQSGSQVTCWGANDFGQLGDGRYASSGVLAPVVAMNDAVMQVAVGLGHSCALTRDGKVWCWGRNDRGQLGSGKPSTTAQQAQQSPPGWRHPKSFATPLAVPLTASSMTLSGGMSCFGTQDGGNCLGWQPYPMPPQLEPHDGSKPDAATKKLIDARNKISLPTPTELGLSGVAEIAVGRHHSCARMTSGAVQCWGAGDRGQLGGGTKDSFKPVQLPGVSGASSLQLGDDFGCVVSSGKVHCWGANDHGQLGRGVAGKPGKPAAVAGLAAVEQLAVGGLFSCALTRDKRVHCWGDGSAGTLGNGKSVSSPTPTPVVW